jgi:hypothetical protein
MSAERYVFDAPVQRLRAGDRIIRGPEPALAERTVLYVESARGSGEPRPFAPIAVITAGELIPTEEVREPVSVGWGTRFIIERIPEADEPYHVSARERLEAGTTLRVDALMALTLPTEEWPDTESGTAGATIEELVGEGALERVPDRGELIEAYWYVDGHRVETPHEQSAREAADLFAAHIVRLHPSGRDAGETCPRCSRVISWVEHLPAMRAGEPVRCMVNVPRVVN